VKARARAILLAAAAAGLLAGACHSAPRKLCKVNEQCFVCAGDKELAKCVRDPATSHCKWTPPEGCR
jgi:hypothetical protein